MRSLLSFLQVKPEGQETVVVSFLNEASKFKPFVFSTDDYFKQMPFKPQSFGQYLPFKYCVFDLTLPYRIQIPSVSAKSFIDTNGVKLPLALGALLRENDDLSIDQIKINADGYDQSGVLQDFRILKRPLANIFLAIKHYKNYEEFWADSHVNIFLNLLADSKNFHGLSSKKIEIKRRGQHPDFVKRLIVISSKASQKTLEKAVGETINWQHQWRVRGHWRKISPQMIGKDREGEYCIVGRTWIKDFVKGDGPLIEKTRIFKGDKNVRSEQSYTARSSGEGPRA